MTFSLLEGADIRVDSKFLLVRGAHVKIKIPRTADIINMVKRAFHRMLHTAFIYLSDATVPTSNIPNRGLGLARSIATCCICPVTGVPNRARGASKVETDGGGRRVAKSV